LVVESKHLVASDLHSELLLKELQNVLQAGLSEVVQVEEGALDLAQDKSLPALVRILIGSLHDIVGELVGEQL